MFSLFQLCEIYTVILVEKRLNKLVRVAIDRIKVSVWQPPNVDHNDKPTRGLDVVVGVVMIPTALHNTLESMYRQVPCEAMVNNCQLHSTLTYSEHAGMSFRLVIISTASSQSDRATLQGI